MKTLLAISLTAVALASAGQASACPKPSVHHVSKKPVNPVVSAVNSFNHDLTIISKNISVEIRNTGLTLSHIRVDVLSNIRVTVIVGPRSGFLSGNEIHIG